ncbi:hypothetical protein DOTSEDRAFT_19656 [Lecanosticta acicola]|uniref:Peptidase A1 domain-containing protein n=1 Tax=Lecanosticta acicola TaxID=111012 RepID=A0AAI8Z196_9PEZI|nr:hypothetical protein DOTSEDRAFT_19656 [Lecanosticta acicola]
MKSRAGFATALLTTTTTPLTCAFSIPSLSLLSRRAIEERATNSTTIPAAIEIGPSQYWDGDDGPWSSFPLQVGHAVQNIRVMVSTAASTIFTVGANGCPSIYPADCADQRGALFLPNESLTWIPNSIFNPGIEANLGLDLPSNVGFDTVTLGWQGSGGPSVSHSTVFNIYTPAYWLGLFGLNPQPTNFTTLNDPQPSFMQQLVSNNTIPSLSYGYTAGNQYRLDKVFGSLVLGGYDSNRFHPTKNVTIPFYSDVSRDLLVNVKSITTDHGSPSDLLPGGSISMYVDSTIAQIWLPLSACTAFEQAFGLTYDNTSEFYLVNSSLHDSLTASNPNVTFTVGASSGSTIDVVLPYGAFDLQVKFPNVMNPNTSYYFPLKRAANDTQYTLGRTFLQEAYIIADYDRANFTLAPCIWESAKVGTSSIKSILRANATSPGTGTGGSTTPTGAVAGGVVGGVVGAVALIGGILYFLRRRSQAEKKRLAEIEANNQAESETKTSQDSNSEGKPFISGPMGGELAGAEVHEMNAPFQAPLSEMDSPYKVDPNKHGYSEMEGGGEYFGLRKDGPAEVHGSTPIYEMAGSDVHEMPAPVPGRDVKF